MRNKGKARLYALLAIAITVAMAAVSGCVPSDPATGSDIGGRLNQVAITAIQSQVNNDPRMAGSEVVVGGDRKGVVLNGTVQSEEQRAAALELVKQYNKELKITDNLSVQPLVPVEPSDSAVPDQPITPY